MNNEIILKLANLFYQTWKDEKQEQGYHLPSLCPNYEKIEDNEEINVNDDLIHCNKCLAALVNFQDLSDFQKKKYIDKASSFYSKLKEEGLDIKDI